MGPFGCGIVRYPRAGGGKLSAGFGLAGFVYYGEVLWLISLMRRIAVSAVVEKQLYVRFVRIMLQLF